MRRIWIHLQGLIALTALFIAVCSISKVVWNSLFSSLVAPPIWLSFIVFIALKRPLLFGLFLIYYLAWVFSFFTLAPLKLILVSFTLLFGLIWLVKQRLYWEGVFYFAILILTASVAFHFTWFLISLVGEDSPTSHHFLLRLVQILVTPALSIPIYFLLQWLDRLLPAASEGESGALRI